ncbi:galactose-1-phosphate uridylyltransferase [Ilumatobacter sp.]|uniref:galactose-1-phosphate uridylyltransferase n=1 Tax=Ilumatobacter sp. TaxID=1967498 RepID=UPI003B51A3CF
MSQMRLNPLNGRWVTIVPDRAARPSDFAVRDRTDELALDRPCPFCPGNEEETPPSIETNAEDGNWSMRVIPNRFPAFDGDDAFAVQHLGPVHVKAEASGIHEVFVFDPNHDGGLQDLDDDHAVELMNVLRRRLTEHSQVPFVRYTQVVVNHGRDAGASIAHPHGQILGLPFVPSEILDEERAFARFAGGSLLTTTLEAELASNRRIVISNDDVVVFCPFASGVPYEMMIVPQEKRSHMPDASDASLAAVGIALRDAIRHLRAALGGVAFNLGVHTAPHQHTGDYHWHVHIWPQLTTQAGFERGTGVLINIVAPEDAADVLRSVTAAA